MNRTPQNTREEDRQRPRCSAPSSRQAAGEDLAASVAAHAAKLTHAELSELRTILTYDVLSEYDARFFSRYLRTLGLDFSETFLKAEADWARDEARHYRFFREAYDAVYGDRHDFDPELDRRSADFAPIAHLFEDEFSIACLGAYDELATVRAFQANLSRYALLGPVFEAKIRRVIADEASHYSRFLRVLTKEHLHRLDEAPAIVQRIRETEGVAYA
ncbi:MAG: hypothetical protein AAF368_07350, partial [Planctomycetota bacterium]